MKVIIKRAILVLADLLFILSGFLKALDSQSFFVLINSYGLHWAGYSAPVICGIEIILGLCLILNIKPVTTSLITGLVTILFTIAFTYAYFFKGVEDCGCMGSFKFFKIPPYISFIRNILIITGCFWIWKFTNDKEPVISYWKKWTVCIIGGLSLCLSGYSLSANIISKNDVHIGDQVNINALHLFDDKISKGICCVFLFNADCNHCWNVTENVKSIKNIPKLQNVIGIVLHGDTTEYMKEMKPNFPVYKYPTNELTDIFGEVPVLLLLKDGKVEMIFNLENIPCGQMLKRISFP